jgi:hypothetical protein
MAILQDLPTEIVGIFVAPYLLYMLLHERAESMFACLIIAAG